MFGKITIICGIAVEDVDEKGICGVICGMISEGNGGGPHRVEVVLDSFSATDSLRWKMVAEGVTDEKGVGKGEEIFVC